MISKRYTKQYPHHCPGHRRGHTTGEHGEDIFEPLFTTKEKGIGLGLAITKTLVEANDGRIEVESEVNDGPTFRIFLPVAKETDKR